MERLDGRFAVRFVYEDSTFWERSAGVSQQQHIFAVLGQKALVLYISNSPVNVKRKIAETKTLCFPTGKHGVRCWEVSV